MAGRERDDAVRLSTLADESPANGREFRFHKHSLPFDSAPKDQTYLFD